MNFLRTVISVCGGTGGFPALLNVHPVRAVFHLLLLILVSASFIAACRLPPASALADRICGELAQRLGQIQDTPEGVVPSKDPDKPVSFILTPGFRLDYRPEKDISLKDMDDWKPSEGIIWTPKALLLWSRPDDSSPLYRFSKLPLVHYEFTAEDFSFFMSKEQIEAFLKKAAATPLDAAGAVKDPFDFTIAYLKSQLLVDLKGDVTLWSSRFVSVSISLLFLKNLLFMCFFLPLIILVLATVQYMFVSGLSPRLLFRNVLAVTVYSAFPGMLIAALVPAFDLPVLSYETAFFISFFIYHMFAFNRVQRFLAPPKSSKPSSSWDDEDDSF